MKKRVFALCLILCLVLTACGASGKADNGYAMTEAAAMPVEAPAAMAMDEMDYNYAQELSAEGSEGGMALVQSVNLSEKVI